MMRCTISIRTIGKDQYHDKSTHYKSKKIAKYPQQRDYQKKNRNFKPSRNCIMRHTFVFFTKICKYYRSVNINVCFYFLIALSHAGFCQDSIQVAPYYQLPKARRSSNELKNIPNLKIFDISYYIGIKGGFKKNWIGRNQTLNTNSQTELSSMYEIIVGQNRNHKYYYETGVFFQKFTLNTTFQVDPRRSFNFPNTLSLYTIPVKLKRRLFYIDRISQHAQINIFGGMNFMVSKLENTAIVDQINFSPQSDAQFFKGSIYSNPSFVSSRPELGLELRGRIVDRLEINVFCAIQMHKKAALRNEILLKLKDGTEIFDEAFLKPSNLFFGLGFTFHSPKYRLYVDSK